MYPGRVRAKVTELSAKDSKRAAPWHLSEVQYYAETCESAGTAFPMDGRR